MAQGVTMDNLKTSIKEELLEAFYFLITDYRSGLIDDATLKERLLMLAERYERSVGIYANKDQAGLF
jgi:hypothetical protein